MGKLGRPVGGCRRSRHDERRGGGVVTNTEGTIGVFAGSTGIVTVTGSSSKWNNSAQLIIANSNLSNGTLNIENGGLVTVDGTTLIGTTGAVNLNGGRF